VFYSLPLLLSHVNTSWQIPVSQPAIQPDVLSHHHSNDLSFWGRVEHVGLCEFRTRLVSFCHTLCVQNVKIHFTRIYGHWPPPTPRHHHIHIYILHELYMLVGFVLVFGYFWGFTRLSHIRTHARAEMKILCYISLEEPSYTSPHP